MTYSPRDLRAIDMLAILFVGFGIVAVAFGVNDFDWAYTGVGIGLAILGFALNIKLLRVAKAGGTEGELTPSQPVAGSSNV